jgi:hypothetical protein
MINNPSEKFLEDKLRKAIKRKGGLALKFTSPGTVGVPDRLIIMPGDKLYLVEMKCPEGQISPIQDAMQGLIKIIGTPVHNIFDESELSKFLEFIDNDQFL